MSRAIPRLERPALDLRRRRFEGSRHGIVVVGSWLNERGRSSQPCLVLLHPARPVAAGKTVPCVVPLSEAWRWAAHGDVGDPEHVARVVNDWLANGYLPGNIHSRRDRLAVLDAVNFYLPDLISMPPQPPADTAPVGEIVAIDRDTGRVITQSEVQGYV